MGGGEGGRGGGGDGGAACAVLETAFMMTSLCFDISLLCHGIDTEILYSNRFKQCTEVLGLRPLCKFD